MGVLQLIGALDPGDVEARPARYEARTGVRLSWLGSGLGGQSRAAARMVATISGRR